MKGEGKMANFEVISNKGAKTDIICCQKGKIRLLSRRELLFVDSENIQLHFQKAFLKEN